MLFISNLFLRSKLEAMSNLLLGAVYSLFLVKIPKETFLSLFLIKDD